jgi:hypothetical protein
MRTHDSLKVVFIAGNIQMLARFLADAYQRTAQAQEHIAAEDCDGAVGALLDLDALLQDVIALHGAVVAIYRNKWI